MKNAIITISLLSALLAGRGAYAQRASGIYVNGAHVSQAELEELQRQLGIPAQSGIPAGNYWYDVISGLWGYVGGPAMGQILPGMPLGGQLSPMASGGGTAVFVNGREIHPSELFYLQQIFGYVMQGRYWMNAAGIGGFEGGPPMFNLAAAAAAAQSGGGGGYAGYTRRTPFGGLGGDGNCSYYLHPDGPSVMNC